MTGPRSSSPAPSRGSERPLVQRTRPGASSAPVPKLRYVVITLMGIFTILGAQLMLSIAVSGGAYEIAGLKGEVRHSQQQLQVVAEDINALTAPDTLAGLAGSMGMVADNNPAYLRLSDAAVLGEAVPASLDSSAFVYSVTAGTETLVALDIVHTVQQSVLGQVGVETVVTDPFAVVEPPTGATVIPASVPTVATVTTPPRFGGTLPSPATR